MIKLLKQLFLLLTLALAQLVLLVTNKVLASKTFLNGKVTVMNWVLGSSMSVWESIVFKRDSIY